MTATISETYRVAFKPYQQRIVRLGIIGEGEVVPSLNPGPRLARQPSPARTAGMLPPGQHPLIVQGFHLKERFRLKQHQPSVDVTTSASPP